MSTCYNLVKCVSFSRIMIRSNKSKESKEEEDYNLHTKSHTINTHHVQLERIQTYVKRRM